MEASSTAILLGILVTLLASAQAAVEPEKQLFVALDSPNSTAEAVAPKESPKPSGSNRKIHEKEEVQSVKNSTNAVQLTSPGTSSSGGFPMAGGSLLSNTVFMSAFSAFFLAQTAKIFTFRYAEGVWEWQRVISSGGMPSSHAAFVMGLTSAIGVEEGMQSSLFALALVFSLIVMYDATGVRRHAGRQATVLNMIISEMPPDHPVQDNGRLRDSLGHSPLQVMIGALLGLTVGCAVPAVALSR